MACTCRKLQRRQRRPAEERHQQRREWRHHHLRRQHHPRRQPADRDEERDFNGGNFTLSGNNQYRGLFVQSGTVAISNLAIKNAVAQGGKAETAKRAAPAAAAADLVARCSSPPAPMWW